MVYFKTLLKKTNFKNINFTPKKIVDTQFALNYKRLR